MIKLGRFNTLKAIRKTRHGFYLAGDEEWGDILLPNKYVPTGLALGDPIEVFVYFDSEDIIISTTRKPKAVVGEFCSMRVSSIEKFGAFLDWGLEKELFVPFREQQNRMEEGKSYVVYVYVDSSDRIAASSRIKKFIKKRHSYAAGQEVDLLLYERTELGIKSIVNGANAGLLFKDDTINGLEVGQSLKGFIKNIREDGKIDLGCKPLVSSTRDELAEIILEKIRQSGGELQVDAKSSAEEINSIFNVSRKRFKVALGYLYKNKRIELCDSGIRLTVERDGCD